MRNLIFLLLLSPVLGTAQKIDSTISKKKIGLLNCEFVKSTEKDSVSYSVGIDFIDGRYPALQEIGLVVLWDQLAVDSLILNLQEAKKYAGGNVTWTLVTRNYELTVFEKSKWITITDLDGAYTNITIAQADKLLEWLRSVKFP